MRKLLIVLVLAFAAGSAATLPASASRNAASRTAAHSDGGVRIVNLNLLHGVLCGDTNFCNGRYKLAIKSPKNALDTEQVLTTFPSRAPR